MSSRTFELSPERWARMQPLFDSAAALHGADRERYLDEHCADDPELRDYVATLLTVDGNIDKTVEHSIASAAEGAFGEDASDRLMGQTIGPYRIERLLGEGGMGMVYLASRADDQFDQQVAIKLGRHRLVDPQTEYRLRHERQILADLDHPNIARLFDGGTTDEGVPYIVMEYIDGVRVDSYCDLQRLNLEERLRLFRRICLAVHHAHQNLIIHRDLKPSNILVTGDGTPKLLDFGIAKLTDAAGAATQGVTREGAVVMTPANATPEQILNQPVTTATDVYGLGLLLYRLLVGLRPFDADGMTPADIARRVCEEPLPTPSSRLKRLTSGPGSHAASRIQANDIAQSRMLTLDRLERRVRGDLDTIVMQALSKDPERRYRSAGAFAEDVELYLKSMPVRARRDSWTYRAAKFVRRHYIGVAVAGMVAALLMTFSIVVSVQNRTIAAERDTAREVSRFLEDIFRAQDPVQARGTSITAHELLETGAQRIEDELKQQPEIQAALMGTIGRVYFNLGVYSEAEKLLANALKLEIEEHGEDHPKVAHLRNDLAEALIRLSQYERANLLLQKALRANQQSDGIDSATAAENLYNLAELHVVTGDLDAAGQFAESSIQIYEAKQADHFIELAEARNMLGHIYQQLGDLDRAESLFLDALSILEREGGTDHPLMGYYLQNLGMLQRTRGNLDAAEISFDQSIEATRKILGEDHYFIAETLIDKGTLLHERGELERAETVLRDALALHAQSRGENHPQIGYDLIILGMLLHDKGDVAEAEAALNDAIDLFNRVLDPEHQYTASAMTELGAVMNTRGQSVRALRLLNDALAVRLLLYDDGNPLVAAVRTELGDAHLRLGDLERAEEQIRKSAAVLADTPGRRGERLRATLERLEATRARTSQNR